MIDDDDDVNGEETGEETTDISDLLTHPMNTWTEQKLLPDGKHVYGVITGYSEGRSQGKKTQFVQVDIQGRRPAEDWTPDEAEGYNFRDYEVNYKFWVTPKALYMFRAFLNSLGFNETRSIRDCMPEMRGAAVLWSGSSQESDRPGPDGKKRRFYNVDTIVGVSD
jgi:hypothetical protein